MGVNFTRQGGKKIAKGVGGGDYTVNSLLTKTSIRQTPL